MDFDDYDDTREDFREDLWKDYFCPKCERACYLDNDPPCDWFLGALIFLLVLSLVSIVIIVFVGFQVLIRNKKLVKGGILLTFEDNYAQQIPQVFNPQHCNTLEPQDGTAGISHSENAQINSVRIASSNPPLNGVDNDSNEAEAAINENRNPAGDAAQATTGLGDDSLLTIQVDYTENSSPAVNMSGVINPEQPESNNSIAQSSLQSFSNGITQPTTDGANAGPNKLCITGIDQSIQMRDSGQSQYTNENTNNVLPHTEADQQELISQPESSLPHGQECSSTIGPNKLLVYGADESVCLCKLRKGRRKSPAVQPDTDSFRLNQGNAGADRYPSEVSTGTEQHPNDKKLTSHGKVSTKINQKQNENTIPKVLNSTDRTNPL